jgi:dTDP-4-amino-4,6-dideoxygalactose transaminase
MQRCFNHSVGGCAYRGGFTGKPEEDMLLASLANRPVASMPWQSFGSLVGRGAGPLPYPFDTPRASYWTSARVALWQAVQTLDLRPGSAVAVPAFCCGAELEPFLMAGLKLSFFTLDDDLSPNALSFKQATDCASAALVTHYFGLPVDLSMAKDVAWQRRIPLIEDCAHALYATDGKSQIGTGTDASVFSFWKTLPIPDGGALHLRAGAVRAAPKAPPPALVKKASRQLLSRALRNHSLAVVRGAESLRQRIRKPAHSGLVEHADAGDDAHEGMKFRQDLAETGMAAQSLRIFRNTDHASVRSSRRRNYQRLEAELAGVPGLVPMAKELSDGACPLYFPVLVEQTASLRRALAAQSIGVKHIWHYLHPDVPWDRFPRERMWKERAIGFPVHQSLCDADIDRLVGAVTRWSRS